MEQSITVTIKLGPPSARDIQSATNEVVRALRSRGLESVRFAMPELPVAPAASGAPERVVRLVTAGARHLGAVGDAATNGVMCGRGDVDVHVAISLDELSERGQNLADWIRNEVIPRIGDHKITLEVLR